MTNTGLFYARFMDDWVVLAPTRPPLRVAIKQANQVLESLKVEKHPDKILDEWPAGLSLWVIDLIASLGVTVLISVHNHGITTPNERKP